jgi:hypothetical protein
MHGRNGRLPSSCQAIVAASALFAWTVGIPIPAAYSADQAFKSAVAVPREPIRRSEGYSWNDNEAAVYFGLAWGTLDTAVVNAQRRAFYRQKHFYGGTPYYGGHYYSGPAYYDGPAYYGGSYHSYYFVE